MDVDTSNATDDRGNTVEELCTTRSKPQHGEDRAGALNWKNIAHRHCFTNCGPDVASGPALSSVPGRPGMPRPRANAGMLDGR